MARVIIGNPGLVAPRSQGAPSRILYGDVDNLAPRLNQYAVDEVPESERGLNKLAGALKMANALADSSVVAGVGHLIGGGIDKLSEYADEASFGEDVLRAETLRKGAIEEAERRKTQREQGAFDRGQDWRAANEQGGAGDVFTQPMPRGRGDYRVEELPDRGPVHVPTPGPAGDGFMPVETTRPRSLIPIVRTTADEKGVRTPLSFNTAGAQRGPGLQLAALTRQLQEINQIEAQGMGGPQLDERRKFILAEMDRLQPLSDSAAFSVDAATPLASGRDTVSTVPSTVTKATPYSPTAGLTPSEQRKYSQVISALQDPTSELTPEQRNRLVLYKSAMEMKLGLVPAAPAPLVSPATPAVAPAGAADPVRTEQLRKEYVALGKANTPASLARMKEIEKEVPGGFAAAPVAGAPVASTPVAAPAAAPAKTALEQQFSGMSDEAVAQFHDERLVAGDQLGANAAKREIMRRETRPTPSAPTLPDEPWVAAMQQLPDDELTSMERRAEQRGDEEVLRAISAEHKRRLRQSIATYKPATPAPRAAHLRDTPELDYNEATGEYTSNRKKKITDTEIIAQARRANTPEARAAVTKMIDEVDIPWRTLGELFTGEHKIRFRKEVDDAYPKEFKQKSAAEELADIQLKEARRGQALANTAAMPAKMDNARAQADAARQRAIGYQTQVETGQLKLSAEQKAKEAQADRDTANIENDRIRARAAATAAAAAARNASTNAKKLKAQIDAGAFAPKTSDTPDMRDARATLRKLNMERLKLQQAVAAGVGLDEEEPDEMMSPGAHAAWAKRVATATDAAKKLKVLENSKDYSDARAKVEGAKPKATPAAPTPKPSAPAPASSGKPAPAAPKRKPLDLNSDD